MHDIDSLRVPEFNFAQIRGRAERQSARAIRRRIAAIATAAVLIPALAVAAVRYLPVRVVDRGNGTLQIYAQSAQANYHPTVDTLRQIARKASYPIVWPMVPPPSKLRMTMVMSSDVIVLMYGCPEKRFAQFIIVPANAAIRGNGLDKLRVDVSLKRTRSAHEWAAGAERVRLDTNCLTASQVAAIKASMIAEGAAQR